MATQSPAFVRSACTTPGYLMKWPPRVDISGCDVSHLAALQEANKRRRDLKAPSGYVLGIEIVPRVSFECAPEPRSLSLSLGHFGEKRLARHISLARLHSVHGLLVSPSRCHICFSFTPKLTSCVRAPPKSTPHAFSQCISWHAHIQLHIFFRHGEIHQRWNIMTEEGIL